MPTRDTAGNSEEGLDQAGRLQQLETLYAVMDLVCCPTGQDLFELLPDVAEQIKQAFPAPEQTGVKIELGGCSFTTSGYQEQKSSRQWEISNRQGLAGLLTVCFSGGGSDGSQPGLQDVDMGCTITGQQAGQHVEQCINQSDGNGVRVSEQTPLDSRAEQLMVRISELLGKAYEHQQVERELRESSEEKETLLSEVHHRVKNNLAVVNGILQMQLEQSESEELKVALTAGALRIRTMALIHEKLYEGKSLSRIAFEPFAKELADSVQMHMGAEDTVDLRTDCQAIELNLNQAVPCALMLNELLTHVIRHACAEVAVRQGDSGQARESPNRYHTGRITLHVEETGDVISAHIRDHDLGLRQRLKTGDYDSSGFNLLAILARQLDADYRIGQDDETVISFSFRKKDVTGAASNLLD